MSSNALGTKQKAVLAMVGIAVLGVMGMILMENLRSLVPDTTPSVTNLTIQATITLFVGAFALLGTFALLIMLIIVVVGLVGVVKGLK